MAVPSGRGEEEGGEKEEEEEEEPGKPPVSTVRHKRDLPEPQYFRGRGRRPVLTARHKRDLPGERELARKVKVQSYTLEGREGAPLQIAAVVHTRGGASVAREVG